MKDFHSQAITTQFKATGDIKSGDLIVIAAGYAGVAKTDAVNGDIISLQTSGKVRVGPGHAIKLAVGATPGKGKVAYEDVGTGTVTDDPDTANNPRVGRFEKDEYDGGWLLLLNAP